MCLKKYLNACNAEIMQPSKIREFLFNYNHKYKFIECWKKRPLLLSLIGICHCTSKAITGENFTLFASMIAVLFCRKF